MHLPPSGLLGRRQAFSGHKQTLFPSSSPFSVHLSGGPGGHLVVRGCPAAELGLCPPLPRDNNRNAAICGSPLLLSPRARQTPLSEAQDGLLQIMWFIFLLAQFWEPRAGMGPFCAQGRTLRNKFVLEGLTWPLILRLARVHVAGPRCGLGCTPTFDLSYPPTSHHVVPIYR